MKENSIERDIHLLESYAGMTHKMNDNQGRPKLDQAIEHILQDYKRVLKEANRYKNMYKAEHEIHLVRNEQLDRKENAVTKCNELIIENAKLKEENEELHKEIERMKSLDIYKLVEDWETGQLIPIQKVKAKIEELDIEISTCEYADDDSEEYKQEVEKNKAELLMTKKVLQQLLESEE